MYIYIYIYIYTPTYIYTYIQCRYVQRMYVCVCVYPHKCKRVTSCLPHWLPTYPCYHHAFHFYIFYGNKQCTNC